MNDSTNYQYAFSCPTTYAGPHGLAYVDESSFYATSWYAYMVASYTINTNLTCIESLFINDSFLTSSNSGSGSRVTVDVCGRSWFLTYNFGLLIFDKQGSYLVKFSRIHYGLFDMVLTENHIMYLSDDADSKILRVNLHITI